MLEAVGRLPDVETPLEDFTLELASPALAFVSYRSATRLADGSVRRALRSSVWVLRDGRWQIRFHQGTLEAGLRAPAPSD